MKILCAIMAFVTVCSLFSCNYLATELRASESQLIEQDGEIVSLKQSQRYDRQRLQGFETQMYKDFKRCQKQDLSPRPAEALTAQFLK